MNRSILPILTTLFLIMGFKAGDPTITIKDLQKLKGCWTGSLTYLDYSTGKPFSMPAKLNFKEVGGGSSLIFYLSYPEEPKANTMDTVFIGEGGRSLNGEKVKQKKIVGKDSLIITTETTGIDGNDNKPALIRHTYNLGRTTYVVRKEVRFISEENWILRHEYSFIRNTTCN